MSQQYQIGLVIFPDMTPLDIIGPHQVFSFIPNARVHLLWKAIAPVRSDNGLTVMPTATFESCPPLDLICVPGGQGQPAMMLDEEVLQFLRVQGKTAKFVTSVCTGSLILAAAGLLEGYRAATHWMFRDQLALMGVEVVAQRVVIDRNRITGGGITAGIDFGLVVVSHLFGEEIAKTIQLLIEYNPAPPFDVGSPEKAGSAIVDGVKTLGKEVLDASLEATKQVRSNR